MFKNLAPVCPELFLANMQTAVDREGNAAFLGANRVIFNIAGNKYRLVVAVKYRWRMVYIRFIGTYSEYDELNRTRRLESI